MSEHSSDARFEELYRLNWPVVSQYLMRRASRDDALEAATETFVAAWRRLDELPPDPTGWLLGAARRQLANVSRGNRRRVALSQRLSLVRTVRSADPADPADDSGSTRVLNALAALSGADQEVLRLVAWEELSAEQIGEVLDCSAAAVRVRVHRARRRLEAQLARQQQHTDNAETTGKGTR